MPNVQMLLHAITGLSPKVLAQSPDHEKTEAANRGLQMFLATTFHFFSMTAALIMLAIEPVIAILFGALTALLLFTADRSLIASLHEQRGNRALHQTGLDVASVLGPVARIGSAIVMGALMAAGLSLALFDNDTRTYVTGRQDLIDAPIIEALNAEYDVTLAQKADGVEASKAALAAADSEAESRQAVLAEKLSATEGQREALTARRAQIWSDISGTRAELEAWTDAAACELSGIADNSACTGTSGQPGDGARRKFAVEKAERLSVALTEMMQELEVIDGQLADAPLVAGSVALVDVDRRQALQAAYDAQVREYRQMVADRPAAIASALAASPDRQVIDPMSIYTRIDALGHLMASSASFFWTALAAKLASVMLELLPLLCELGRRPAVYDINIAASVHTAFRKHRKIMLEDEAEDLPLFAEVDRRRREIEREAFVASFMRRDHTKTTPL